jgi:hypothetical protein
MGLCRGHRRQSLLYAADWFDRCPGRIVPGRNEPVKKSRGCDRLHQGLYDRLGLGIWCQIHDRADNDRFLGNLGLGVIKYEYKNKQAFRRLIDYFFVSCTVLMTISLNLFAAIPSSSPINALTLSPESVNRPLTSSPESGIIFANEVCA